MTTRRRNRIGPGAIAVLATVLSGAILGGATADAQTYPARPIQVIVPFAGGSASDVVTRIMLDRMAKSIGQPFIVDNRPGAGGNTGTAAAAKAAPDGYTLVATGSGPVAANKTLYRDLGYDPEKDFEAVTPFAFFPIVVVASTKLPVKTLAELIAYVKQHPGELNYGSVGIGSSQHLGGVFFEQLNRTQLPNVLAPLNSGGAITLAVAGKDRLPALPDTPTTIEAGLPAYQAAGWFAIQVPRGTPKDIVARISREMAAAVADPVVR